MHILSEKDTSSSHYKLSQELVELLMGDFVPSVGTIAFQGGLRGHQADSTGGALAAMMDAAKLPAR